MRSKSVCGETEEFSMRVVGSPLNCYLFFIVMDIIIKDIQDDVPLSILFVVLVEKDPEEVKKELEEWKTALGGKGPRIKLSKTEAIMYYLGVINLEIYRSRHVMKVRYDFVGELIKFQTYLGSEMLNNDDFKDDIRNMIMCEWMKRIEALSNLDGQEDVVEIKS